MNKLPPGEFLAKITKKINLKDLLSLKADLKVLLTKKISLQDLQELFTKITQNKNKLIAVVAVISIILYLDFSFVLKFQMNALGKINPQVIRLKKGLQNLNSDLIAMQRHEQGLGVGATKKLVAAGQVPWVIEEISHLANQQEVRISQIKPIRNLSDESSLAEEYSLIIIDLEATAGYHQLGRFLANLENHPILLGVEQLDIKQTKDPFEHKIKLRLRTYVANE